MLRRVFATGLGAAVLLPASPVLATPNPFRPPDPDETSWAFPGTRAIKNLKGLQQRQRREMTLRALFEGSSAPRRATDAVTYKVLNESPTYTDRISLNYRPGRMGFATDDFRGVVVIDKVVAVTDRPGWVGKSLKVIGWQYFDRATNTDYIVEEPEVCENLLFNQVISGVCIKDEVLCKAECERLRRLLIVGK